MNIAFKPLGPQYAVDQDAGISVEITGPYSVRYTDNDRVASIATEPVKDGGRYKVCFYLADLQQWDDPADQNIADSEKRVIETRLKDAMKTLNVEMEVA